MTPRTEPNSLPPLFIDWRDWLDTYITYAEDFRSGSKRFSDAVLLEIRLKRLGFYGVNLDNEIKYIKETNE